MSKKDINTKEIIKTLFKNYDGKFSKSLGIELKEKKSDEIFKWFLASILYGARIGEKIATNTYYKFEKRNVVTPEKILKTEWDGLVEILDVGGYVRYDFKTATNIFLRELRGIWEKADPNLSSFSEKAACNLNLLKIFGKNIKQKRKNLNILKEIWNKNRKKGYSFSDFEACLVRLGKDFCRKKQINCPLRTFCKNPC